MTHVTISISDGNQCIYMGKKEIYDIAYIAQTLFELNPEWSLTLYAAKEEQV